MALIIGHYSFLRVLMIYRAASSHSRRRWSGLDARNHFSRAATSLSRDAHFPGVCLHLPKCCSDQYSTFMHKNRTQLDADDRFLSLIEREWLQSGHPFRERCAYGPFRTQLLASASSAMSAFGRLKQAAFSFASATDPSGGLSGAIGFSSANPDAVSSPTAAAGNTSAQLLALQQQTFVATRPARGLVAPTFILFLDTVYSILS